MGAHDFTDLILRQIFGMLGRDHNGRGLNRSVVFIKEGDLAFRIRAEPRFSPGMTGIGKRPQDSMGKMNGRRHKHVCLGTGVTEHYSLVTGPFIFIS